MSGAAWELIVGIPLVFFVPGYTVTRAMFPEWRVRGAMAFQRGLEIATLAFVLSVVLTVVVGWLLLALAPNGFVASWSDPVLQVALAAIAVVGFVAGLARGAYRADPPPAPEPEADVGEEGAWELTRRLEALAREERRLNHELRVGSVPEASRASVRRKIEELRTEEEALGREREAAYER